MQDDGTTMTSPVVAPESTALPSMPPSDARPTHWISPSSAAGAPDCYCIGTGRFLRAVLVPALVQSGYRPALIQPRGRSFLNFVLSQPDEPCGARLYPIDTVLESGEIRTDHIPIYGAFSLGSPEDRQALLQCGWTTHVKHPPRILGVGVTEAGLAHYDTPIMQDLYEILLQFHRLLQTKTWSFAQDQRGAEHTSDDEPQQPRTTDSISVINTDNVPMNGNVLKGHMFALAKEDAEMIHFLQSHVYFHNTMVDRITSHRPNNALVPRAEPLPTKALVILDPDRLLMQQLQNVAGVVLRTQLDDFQADVELKLRIANGTHTALAHLLALLQITSTDHVIHPTTHSPHSALLVVLDYLDALFDHAILPGWVGHPMDEGGTSSTVAVESRRADEAQAVYRDWRQRLWHPHFGLSTFFITQNGAAKGGLRLGPTVHDLLLQHPTNQPVVPVVMAFAWAVLLRWLTPDQRKRGEDSASKTGVYRGWLQPSLLLALPSPPSPPSPEPTEYADHLRYDLADGWYEFRCACRVADDAQGGAEAKTTPGLSDYLAQWDRAPQSPSEYHRVIRAYLEAQDGGCLGSLLGNASAESALDALVRAIAALYARMVAGDDLLELLREMKEKRGIYREGMRTNVLDAHFQNGCSER